MFFEIPLQRVAMFYPANYHRESVIGYMKNSPLTPTNPLFPSPHTPQPHPGIRLFWGHPLSALRHGAAAKNLQLANHKTKNRGLRSVFWLLIVPRACAANRSLAPKSKRDKVG
jgi:hypothetical protein